jgi:hypothetical protein
MRSRDVISLYNKVGVGAKVEVTTNHLPGALVKNATDPAPVQQLTMPPQQRMLGPITPTPGTSAPPQPITTASRMPRRG